MILVSWDEALAYCRWLTRKLRSSDVTPEPVRELLAARKPGAVWQVTLPTEAEWEKAARGTSGRIFPWGDEPEPDKANYSDTGIQSTSGVGCFTNGASPYGVEELSGNVWEWCRDWYGDYPKGPVSDPSAPKEGRRRVLRGGAWFYSAVLCRSAYRRSAHPSIRLDLIGFRVVLAPRSGAQARDE